MIVRLWVQICWPNPSQKEHFIFHIMEYICNIKLDLTLRMMWCHCLFFVKQEWNLHCCQIERNYVQDCNRVVEVRRGLVVSTVLFPSTSLKYRVIKTLELCSCGKEKKRKEKKKKTRLKCWRKCRDVLWRHIHSWMDTVYTHQYSLFLNSLLLPVWTWCQCVC